MRRRAARAALIGLALGLGVVAPAPAQEPEEAPSVELDRLLQLPSSHQQVGEERRGGKTRGEWRSNFDSVRLALEREEALLDQAQADLAEAAGAEAGAWQVGLPIAGNVTNNEGPIDYQLYQAIKRHKAEIERLERRLLDLEVEANLAGVPEDWRE